MSALPARTLADRLAARIAADGPMRVADWMAACLTDPEGGYYTGRDPLGAAGDFTTAPEISQMFGEMLGLWAAQVWIDQGRPAPFTLAELGPGRGTLMADALRAGRAVPGFLDAAQLWLVEVGPALRAEQRQRLGAVRWADSAAALPADAPLIVLANEFFDALPVRQFVRRDDGWAERMVGLADGRFAFGLAPPVGDAELDRRFPGAAAGTVVETCAPGEAVAATLAGTVAARGGACLAIDYGEWEGTGDTLQAVARHAAADPLAAPGTADLTAHVGFRWLAEAARPLAPRLDTQGAFLERLGITARAQALARAPGADADDIAARHRRLLHPQEMGHLFKALALTPPAAPAPPGFPA